jgi:hypothetical protein
MIAYGFIILYFHHQPIYQVFYLKTKTTTLYFVHGASLTKLEQNSKNFNTNSIYSLKDSKSKILSCQMFYVIDLQHHL